MYFSEKFIVQRDPEKPIMTTPADSTRNISTLTMNNCNPMITKAARIVNAATAAMMEVSKLLPISLIENSCSGASNTRFAILIPVLITPEGVNWPGARPEMRWPATLNESAISGIHCALKTMSV
jgi:hypothetical protein